MPIDCCQVYFRCFSILTGCFNSGCRTYAYDYEVYWPRNSRKGENSMKQVKMMMNRSWDNYAERRKMRLAWNRTRMWNSQSSFRNQSEVCSRRRGGRRASLYSLSLLYSRVHISQVWFNPRTALHDFFYSIRRVGWGPYQDKFFLVIFLFASWRHRWDW